jgi:hypothetical protein
MNPGDKLPAAEAQPGRTSDGPIAPAAAPKKVLRNPACAPVEALEKVNGVLRRIQAARGRRLFVLMAADINEDAFDEVCRWRAELKEAGSDEKLDVLLHTPGGGLSLSYQIARLFARSANSWEALVPAISTSGATLISLGSARIVMSEVAQLGPIDPQVLSRRSEKFFAGERQSPLEAFQAVKYLREFSITSLDAMMKLLVNERGLAPKPALETSCNFGFHLVQPILAKIDPYDLGSFALDATLAIHYCERIGNPTDPQKKTQRGVPYRDVVVKYPAHEFVIDIEEAKELNFNVVEPSAEVDALFDEIAVLLNDLEYYIGFVPESEDRP